MDSSQGESGGGKSLTSKLKAKVPHSRGVKDKVKHLKSRLPGMKKHSGDDDPHEDSSEYDDNSPRSPRPVVDHDYDSRPAQINPTGYDSHIRQHDSKPTHDSPTGYDSQNRSYDSRPAQISPTSYDSQNPHYDSKPAQISPTGYDSQNRNYDSKPAQISPTGYDSQTRNYDSRPSQNSPTGYDSQNRNYDSKPAQISPTGYDSQTRNYDSRPSQNSPTGYDSQNRNYVPAAPPTRPAPLAPVSPRSNLAPTLQEKFNYLDVGEQRPRHGGANPHTEEQLYSPPATETAQKGYSDVPSKPYRSNPAFNPAAATTIATPTPTTPRTPTTPTNKGVLEKVRDTVTGATVALGDKMGFYNEHTPSSPRDPNAPSLLNNAKATLGMDKPRDPNAPSLLSNAKATLGMDKPRNPNAPSLLSNAKATLGMDKPSDPNAPSILDKAKATLGVDKPRDPNAPSILDKAKSTLGVDKPRDPNAPPLTERAKSYMNVASQKTREYSATAADRAAWTKDRVAAQTTPTHDDKALSEQVTQSLSTLPGAIREKVFGGPGAASSPSEHAAAAPAPASPGIVNRVSGAVSSLFTAVAPKASGEHLQHTFPAHSDEIVRPREGTSAATPFADHSGAQERMPATSNPAYPPVNY